MSVNQKMADIIRNRGCTQAWVIKQMNIVCPSVSMTKNKMCNLVSGKRSAQADELLAFCMALNISPDVFIP